MTNTNKPESDQASEAQTSFDGITFEVEEEEHTQEGNKVKRRGGKQCTTRWTPYP